MYDDKGITQREKREVLENDRKVRGTYHSVGHADVDTERGGRYVVRLTTPTMPGWPSLWANDPPEPPLGYSVNEQEPVGERHEIEASKTSTSGEQPSHVPVQTGVGVGGDDGPRLAKPVVVARFLRRF
jgi:hypothetical protein